MTNGSMVLNGITEKQLVVILQFKLAHEGQLAFSPQALQVASNPPNVIYNNAGFSWTNEPQLRLVLELVGSLLAPIQ